MAMKQRTITFFTILLFYLAVGSCYGQDIVITLTDTLSGEVQLDLPGNKLRIQQGKRHQVLPASQVRWIRKNGRNYCVASFGIESKMLIFEVLSRGSKSLIYREGVRFNPYDEESFPPFFILEHRSAYAVGSKKEVLSVFGPGEKKVKDFAKNEGLSFSEKKDLSLIFDYFNQLE